MAIKFGAVDETVKRSRLNLRDLAWSHWSPARIAVGTSDRRRRFSGRIPRTRVDTANRTA